MNIQYVRARFTMILYWVLFMFLAIDFAITGPENFLNRFNFLITATVIFITMVVFFFMLHQTNKKENVVDERDTMILQKATSISLIITTMFVFLFAISLFIVYEDTYVLPISWLWLIAYMTFATAYLSSSTITVLLYKRENAEE